MTDHLGPESQELVRRARESDPMPAAYKRQLKGVVLARIALASQGALAAGQAARFGTSLGAKAVVAVAVAGALGVGGYRALRPARPPAPIGARHAPEAAPTAAAAVAPEEPAPTPAAVEPAPKASPHVSSPHVRRTVAHTVARAVATTDTGTLDRETALLREADRALRDGNTAKASAKLDEHAALFPNGTLAPERAAERLLVTCRLGAADPRAVARFLATSPGSPLAARVRRECETGGATPAPLHAPSTGQSRARR